MIDSEEAQSATQQVIEALSDLDLPGEGETAEVDLEAELLRPEIDLGSNDRARQANACMLSLARASRSYLIYDPRNQVIRKFLLNVQRAFETFSTSFGDMELQVRPFELVLDGEVIYVERDWERSLAFKLFRDGVRKLVIQSGITWEELTRLLQILSIRFVGVRLQEDDILTLLWKASFENIQIEAVEGFVPVDDEDEIAAAAAGAAVVSLGVVGASESTGATRAPSDFDLPAPDLPDPIATHHVRLSNVRLNALRDEFASRNVADDVLDLCAELLTAAADPVDLMGFEDCGHFLRETREFLLSEDDLPQLIALNQLLARFVSDPRVAEDPKDAARVLMEGFTSERALRKLLASIDRNANVPPDELFELLRLHPSDPLPSLLAVLAEERTGQPRRMARILVEGYLPDRVKTVMAAYNEHTDEVAADLLRILAAKAPEAVHELFNELVHNGSRAEKLEFLNQAQSADFSRGLRSFLTILLEDPEITVRMKTLEIIGNGGEAGAYPMLHRYALTKAKAGAEERELETIGRVMAQVNAQRSLEQFEAWALPSGFFNKLKAQTGHLRRVAVAGLIALRGDDADGILREVATTREDDVAKQARDALRRRGTLAHPLIEPGGES